MLIHWAFFGRARSRFDRVPFTWSSSSVDASFVFRFYRFVGVAFRFVAKFSTALGRSIMEFSRGPRLTTRSTQPGHPWARRPATTGHNDASFCRHRLIGIRNTVPDMRTSRTTSTRAHAIHSSVQKRLHLALAHGPGISRWHTVILVFSQKLLIPKAPLRMRSDAQR